MIDENLAEPAFSIDTICQTLGISRSQLHRTVKEQTGLSTTLFIRKRRLLKAKDLLLSTDLRISELCDAVGISNPQNFSTYFTEEYQISPTEFRKLHQRQSPVAASLPPEVPQRPAAEPPVLEAPRLIPEQPTEPLPIRLRFRFRWRLVWGSLVAGLLLFVVGGLSGWFQPRSDGRAAKLNGNSLAVLPFTNLGPTDSNPACEAIMNELHASVSLLKNLKVIARSSSDQYRDTQKTTWQIGDELQVANVLKGSVLKTVDRLQIKVEIINTQEDIRVWVKTYRASYQELFRLTDQIVQDVATQLKLTLNASASEKLALARTRKPDAYNAFLQGRQLLINRRDADVLASIIRFDRALALDSTFAEAHAGKAVAYHLLIGSGKADTQTLNRRTEESALQAIRLDPTNSTAYGVLGSLYCSTYQWQASEDAFRIALQHNPSDAQANYWYSLLLRMLGRVDEAVHYSTQAIALDPLHPIMIGGHIANCVYANRFDSARESIEAGRGFFDKSFAYQWAQAIYWMGRAEYDRAVPAYQLAQMLNPDDKGQTPIRMYCEAKRGNRKAALRFLRELTATTPRSDYERAVVYAGLAQADSSLYFLKKAADGGYLYRDTKVLPVFRPYHAHPVFRAVMRQFKLPEG